MPIDPRVLRHAFSFQLLDDEELALLAAHVDEVAFAARDRLIDLAPELALRPEADLVRMTTEDLAILLGITGQPTFKHSVLYPKAIPQYEIGYGHLTLGLVLYAALIVVHPWLFGVWPMPL